MQRVVVQSDPFEVQSRYTTLIETFPGAAVATFTGYVRDFCDNGDVFALELEHYPGMTETVLESLGEQAGSRFALKGWQIIHRFGRLVTADPIVWVGVVADHRTEAFGGCQFIMDALKTDAPFWKREHLDDGSAHWVTAQYADSQRRKQWQLIEEDK